MIGIICLFSAGYAAFSSNFLVSGKGTIVDPPITIDELKERKVTNGNGLYEDIYENNRYIYRGTNPDNYITFNNDLWRIVSIENDNMVKIVKNESIGEFARDVENERYKANTYCGNESNKLYGCEVWGSSTTTLDSEGNRITRMSSTAQETLLPLPELESSLNRYLNGEYYNSLNSISKSQIVVHKWNVGRLFLNQNQTLEEDIFQEKLNKWEGNVALINVTDYIRSSTNPECKSLVNSRSTPYPCGKSNWLTLEKSWTLSTGFSESTHSDWGISKNSITGNIEDVLPGHSYANSLSKIYPAVFLNSNIKLSGKGTIKVPYNIIFGN